MCIRDSGTSVTIPQDKDIFIAIDKDYTPYLWVYIRNRSYNAASNDNILETAWLTGASPTTPPGLWKITPLGSTFGPSSDYTTLASTSLPIFE